MVYKDWDQLGSEIGQLETFEDDEQPLPQNVSGTGVCCFCLRKNVTLCSSHCWFIYVVVMRASSWRCHDSCCWGLSSISMQACMTVQRCCRAITKDAVLRLQMTVQTVLHV